MPLKVSFIERLDQVLDHAVAFLNRDDDLFARPRIVVPTPGAKAWLQDRLARRLGGVDGEDGVVANVHISYPATITALLQPTHGLEPDPWSFDPLTFTVLDVITEPGAAEFGVPLDVVREPLLAARRIAGLFDTYHDRRPAMIRLWEEGRPALSPVAVGRDYGGEWAADALPESDAWQFRVWQAVRQRIAQPSPPQRMGVDHLSSRDPILVAGLQSLSLQQIAAIKTLAGACDVHVLLVHPSPPLQARWAAGLPPVSESVPPKREAAELPDDLDPLVATWLHGARETQMLLGSQGIIPEPGAATGAGTSAEPATLLARMQQTIATAHKPVKQQYDPAHDHSFSIHRCYSLSRQAEAIHDAILHAFVELDDLHPHEIVIVSPCLERLAPHLEAVFDREIEGQGGHRVKLPLVVADRGLNQVSEAAELLVELLGLVGSRCSVEKFRAVAAHPLVTRHFHADDETVRCWDQLIERTRIHWGFDAAHRLRENFPAEAAEPHTWRAGLERMVLGATLPDADPRPELGGTVPLADVPLADLSAIVALARIFEVVLELDAATAAPRPAGEWCGAVERALFDLCGEEASELADPLRMVRELRDSASQTPVPFGDVREILSEALQSAAGRQPLRTGAITATSMVPLRDVPFRVVCVAAYDDGTVAAAESRGDDLVARQPLAGDGDPRIDIRRALLDCLLAARDRVVITCNGSNIKNNQPLPLVTPLAELIDFAVRHGVAEAGSAAAGGVEVTHPRHAVGHRNFRVGEVQPGVIWSHDAAARAASLAMGGDEPEIPSEAGSLPQMPVTELAMVEEMVRDPLGLYLKKTLGISTWRDDEEFPAATFPLAMADRDQRDLTAGLLDVLVAGGSDEAPRVREWLAAVRASGRVPFGRFGDAALREIQELAHGLRRGAADQDPPIPLAGFEAFPVRIHLAEGLLAGHVSNLHRESNQIVHVRVTEGDRTSWGMPLHIAALHLLVLQAAGTPAERAVVVARHKEWKVGGAGSALAARTVRLADALCNRVAATERLAAICGLVPRALASPCGRFGGAAAATVKDREKGRAAFVRQVGWGFDRSKESVVYGPAPRFDDVFAPSSPEMAFHALFERLFTITGRYTLS
jgi:exodeoxyribonuclease V gamma subunit